MRYSFAVQGAQRSGNFYESVVGLAAALTICGWISIAVSDLCAVNLAIFVSG